jgi:hypothetical protein
MEKSQAAINSQQQVCYKLQMNITDQTGLTTLYKYSGDLEAIVVIYDPNGGNTYGWGIITRLQVH